MQPNEGGKLKDGVVQEPHDPGPLQLAHVLFIDIVAFSVLLTDEQLRVVQKLQDLVRATPRFQRAEASKDVIALPTGDGMALLFFGDPASAAECALELAKALRSEPAIKVRMGLHTGPVFRTPDINANLNAIGRGVNVAQRVMDACDPGQILVSEAMAEVLLQLGRWKPYLFDLGVHPVKYGDRVHFFNFYTGEFGVEGPPQKWKAPPPPAWLKAAILVLLFGSAAGAAIWLWLRPAPGLAHELDYSITVQRYKDGQPYREPFQLAHEMLFENDFRIALNITSPAAGYLYLLNDGPLPDGSFSVNMLYPGIDQPAYVSAGTTIRVPTATWIRFDEASGTEKLYLVWSERSSPQMEAWRTDTHNMRDGHVVFQGPKKLAAIRDFLQRALIPASAIQGDEQNHLTRLRSNAALFAHVIQLEHH
jgi:class 3 adenylate cyclase